MVMDIAKLRDEMMTKRLPHITHHRPYKYQELRRKFKVGADNSAARGEEEYRNLLRSRERTNLATARSNTNLATSRENLAASRDSLVIPEENVPTKEPNSATRQSYDELRGDITARQTSLDQLNRRTEQGKNVYSFTLSKADRSKSDPMLFPPLNDKSKATKASHQATPAGQKGVEHLPPQPTPVVERKEKENKPISTVKFPIVSRYDLYKHLGIPQGRRKRLRRDSDATETRNYAKNRQTQSQQQQQQPQQQLQTPRIMPEASGKSRNVSAMYANKDDQKKIELYKQWHEDQANQRRSRDYDTKEAARLATIYKERYQSDDIRTHTQERLPTRNRRDATLPKIGLKDRSNAGKLMESLLDGSYTDRSRKDTQSRATNQRVESPPAPVPEELLRRQYSAKTWRTWRHHNDSYAYDDVDQYIEENELMDDEKMYFIQQWIVAVAKATTEDDKDSDDEDVNEVGTIQGSSTDQTDRSIPDTNVTKV